ncbi:MAG TPA: PE-PPE domain-containing protein [Mycobacterium sp.]
MNSSAREGRWHGGVSARSQRAVLLAVVVALLTAFSSGATALGSTALMVSGIGQSTLPDITMSMALDGKYDGIDPASGTPWVRKSVYWPARDKTLFGFSVLGASVAVGTANLLQAIKDTYNASGQAGNGAARSSTDPITVIGISAGTIVVDEVMRQLANDPTAPPPSAIKFVVLADASQKHAGQAPSNSKWDPFSKMSGYTFKPPPVTSYDLTVVTYEYDGWADFPDRWWNGLAVANAMAGALILHPATWLVDLSTVPASDIKVTTNASGGTTTSYLVEPKTLPLVIMNPRLAPREAELKAKIDAAYSRNDPKPPNSSSSAAVAALASDGQSSASADATANSASPVNASSKPIRALIDRLKAKATPQTDSQPAKPAGSTATKSDGNSNDRFPRLAALRDRLASAAGRADAGSDTAKSEK